MFFTCFLETPGNERTAAGVGPAGLRTDRLGLRKADPSGSVDGYTLT
mgnify:FL=1